MTSTHRARVRRPVASPEALSPETPLTPLGLSTQELAQALGRYRLRLHALMHALGSSAPITLHHDAFPALEDLRALLEVDVGARATPVGGARMSELERALLVPLLARLQQRLAELAAPVPSRDWLPALEAADEDVALAEHGLARH